MVSQGGMIVSMSYTNKSSGKEYGFFYTATEVSLEKGCQWMDEARAQALAGKVNFAGHYALHRVGCSGSTMCVEVLDAQTGEVATGLPNAYDGNLLTLSYQPDSNLIIVSGITANTEEDMKGKRLKNRDRTHYYEFVNNEIRLLKITDS